MLALSLIWILDTYLADIKPAKFYLTELHILRIITIENCMQWIYNIFRGIQRSRYAKPIIFFVFFFLVSSSLIWWFELNSGTGYFMNIRDGLWWSLVTFSTTGYGDKVPVTIAGRVWATFTIIVGVVGSSLLSGALASWLVDRNSKAQRGLMEYKNLKNHLVICGWRNDMQAALVGILHAATGWTSEDIVIISNVDSSRIGELRETSELRDLKFVHGDYFSDVTLNRASVKTAKKVIILADTLESTAVSEVDSKTVMTVLTIRSISRDVYVAAEILDQKYENYLKQALCDEILLSRDFSRQILVNTSVVNGMSHIFDDLLKQSEGTAFLTTQSIDMQYINQKFEILRDALESPTCKLIGLLENAGNPNQMKLESLREAQKTSDVSKLVQNLHQVKGLEVNKPLFLPSSDYMIQAHTQAIILERIHD